MISRSMTARVGANVRAAVPVAVLTSVAMKSLRLRDGMRVVLVHGSVELGVWVSSVDPTSQKLSDGVAVDDYVWLSWRTFHLLHLSPGVAKVELRVPDALVFQLRPGVVDDLPLGNEAHVDKATVRAMVLAMLPARYRVPPKGRWP